MYEVFTHLLQSTLFAGVAGLLTLLLKKNHARARYWLWLAASVKFLIPFSVLVNIGSRLVSSTAHPVIRRMTVIVEEVRLPNAPLMFHPAAPIAHEPAHTMAPWLLPTLWACGFMAILFFWWRRWRSVIAVVRAAVPLTEGREFDALKRVESMGATGFSRCGSGGKPRAQAKAYVTHETLEPGIFGVFRPILLLPAGIGERLDDAQLEAIVAHELCHARRRDNLAAAIHMSIEAVFWFHPLVWWLGARLVDERERACDEEVLRQGSQPDAYAEGILKVCRFYLESPLVCVAGITGSNLKRRIERIMTRQTGYKLSLGRKLLLGVAALTSLAAPLTIGLLNAPPSRAQTPAGAPPVFEVASIKLNKSGARGGRFSTEPGGIVATNMPLRTFIKAAYGIQDYQLSGGPSWLDSERYDIAAKSEGPALDEKLLMLRALLEDRFKLTLHREKKELPGYALVIGKSGLKIHAAEHEGENWMRFGWGSLTAREVSMARLAESLSGRLGRPVVDNTGVQGLFDFNLQWTPDRSEPKRPKESAESLPADDGAGGPSIFTALQEQLGLKLEPRKGPVEILVIDRIEKPSEN